MKDLATGDIFRVDRFVRKSTQFGYRFFVETSQDRAIYVPQIMDDKIKSIIDEMSETPSNLLMEYMGPTSEHNKTSTLFKFYIKNPADDALS